MSQPKTAAKRIIYPGQLICLERHIQRKSKSAFADRLMEKADSLVSENEFRTATAYYTIAIGMTPSNGFLFNKRGLARHDDKDFSGALSDFESAIGLVKDYHEAYSNAAISLMKGEHFEHAMEFIDAAISITKSIPDYYVTRGRLFKSLDENKSAIKDFSMAMKMENGTSDPHFERAMARWRIGHLNGAISDLNVAASIEPNMHDTYFSLARIYLETGNPVMALHNFNMAIKKGPSFADAYKERASLFFSEGNVERYVSDMDSYVEKAEMAKKAAISYDISYDIANSVILGKRQYPAYFDAMISLNNGNLDDALGKIDSYIFILRSEIESILISKKGRDFRNRKMLNEATRLFTKAIEADHDDPDLYVERGATKAMARDHKGAILDFTTAINMGERTKEIFVSRANSRIEAKDYEGAIKDLSEALKFGNDADLLFRRGCTYHKAKKYHDAIHDFESLIILDRNGTKTYYQISISRYELGDILGALRDIEMAISLDHAKTVNYILHSAMLRERLLDYRGAIDDYTKAIELDPNDSNTYEKRSTARYEIGDIEGYFKDSEKAKTLEEDDN